MSNFLAVATVTATLRRLLNASVDVDVPGARASALRPDDTSIPTPGVNIYLYQVVPNTAWQSTDLPTRSAAGALVQRPRIALDLHYLLSFHGDDAQLEPQRVLGSAVRTLHARPILSRDTIRLTTADAAFSYVSASDLADEVELVKYTQVPLSIEELSKLWSVFFQTPYTVSVAYRATVVLIEADDTPQRVLPVRTRSIVASPFQRARIDEVVPANPARVGVEVGDTVVVRGSQLTGTIARVRVGPAELQPVDGSVTPTELEVALVGPSLRAGLLGVQVVYTIGSESNVAALVLRPRVTVDQASVTAELLPLDFTPPVDRRQRVQLLLNERNAPAGSEPHAYVFDAPPSNGIANPGVDDTARIEFVIADVDAATYLVRVLVGGAESLLTVDGAGRYDGPTVVVPP